MAYYQQGLYDVEITGNGLGESDQKKTPFVFVSFYPTHLNGDPIDGVYEREAKLYLTDNTIDRVMEHLRGLGWTGGDFSDFENGGLLAGQTCKLRCMWEQVNDKEYENWEFPAPGGQRSETVAGVGKKLNALFGKAAKASAMTPKAAEAAAKADAQMDGDDPPF